MSGQTLGDSGIATVMTARGGAGSPPPQGVISPPPPPPPAAEQPEPAPLSAEAQAMIDFHKEEAMKNRLKYKQERDSRSELEARAQALEAEREQLLAKLNGMNQKPVETPPEQSSSDIVGMTPDERKLYEERFRAMEERLNQSETARKEEIVNKSITGLFTGRVVDGAEEFLLTKFKNEGFQGNRVVFDDNDNSIKIVSDDGLQATNGKGGKLTLADLVDGFLKSNTALLLPAGGTGGAGTEMLSAVGGGQPSFDAQVNQIYEFRKAHQAWPQVRMDDGNLRPKTPEEFKADIAGHLKDYEIEQVWAKSKNRLPAEKPNGWPGKIRF